MRIAFISYNSPVDYSGSSRYIRELSLALAILGIDVTVFTARRKTLPMNSIYPHEVEKLSCIDLPYFRFPTFALAVSKTITKNHFDIVHSSAGSGIFSPVLHVETHHHTPLALHAFPHYLPAFLSAIRAKRVIAVSEVSKRDLMRYGISEHKIVVIPDGVNFNKFNPSVDGSMFRDALGIGDAKLLLYVGGFNKNKNLIFLLKVIKRLKKMRRKEFLLMVGAHDNEERRLLNVARELAVLDVVRTMYLSDDILPQAYAACDLFVFSSKKEGFGLPLLEAVACGKRFVSTPVGIAPKLAKMGFGRIASYSINNFLSVIIRELNEQPHSPSLQILKKEFDWINVATKTTQVYEMIMES